MNEESEQELKQLIEMNANDTKILSNLIANQTEIVSTEFGILQNKAYELEGLTQKLIEQQNASEHQITLTAAMELFMENVIQYEIDTETLTDAVLFATQGMVHPHFIAPDQITKTSQLVKETVPDAIFPMNDDTQSITEIIKISEITILFTNFHLIYYVSIPLLDYTNYQLFKMSPLPIYQHSLNVSTAFAYIWPESEYYAISSRQDAFMTLHADTLNKCKRLKDLFICKASEPVREINEKSACEIKLCVNGNIANLDSCKIKIIKLEETFWSKTQSPNTWVFSTKTPERLLINCKQTEDRTIIINKTGLLRLPSGCTARNNFIRLVSSREIKVENHINVFNNTYLDVASIINNTNTEYPSYVKSILEEKEAFKGVSSQANTPVQSLKLGSDLREIIEKARRIGEYKNVSQKFTNLHNTLSYSGVTVVIIIIFAVIVCKVPWVGESLSLMFNRLFSGNSTKNQASTPSARWVRDADDVLYQPRQSLSMPAHALSLPNIQQLAIENNIPILANNMQRYPFESNQTISIEQPRRQPAIYAM